MKKTIFVFIFLFSVLNSYSYTNLSTCQEILSPGEYRLNLSVGPFVGNCFNISTSNVSLSCDSLSINGNSSSNYGIYSNGNNNISINNCNLLDNQILLNSNTNIHLDNINFTNGELRMAFNTGGELNNLDFQNGYLRDSNYNLNFTNITINYSSQTYGIETQSSQYNNYENIKLYNLNYGIHLNIAYDLNINNFLIVNSSTGIYSNGMTSINFTNGVIKNISNAGIGEIRNFDNCIFENITISNIISGEAIDISRPTSGSDSNNYFRNLNISNVDIGIHIDGGDFDNNYFYNNHISSSDSSFEFISFFSPSPSNNYIYNNSFDSVTFNSVVNSAASDNFFYENTIDALRMEYLSTGIPTGNTFYNNTFTNISKINLTNVPDNNFNYSGFGNTYYNTSQFSGVICFGSPQPCDNFAEVEVFPLLIEDLNSVSSLFPFQRSFSLYLIIGILTLFFI